jgi:hypothetical protein
VADEERGAVKIVEGERLLSPEALVAMVLTYAKSLAQASPPPRAPPRPRPRPRGFTVAGTRSPALDGLPAARREPTAGWAVGRRTPARRFRTV